MQSAPSHPAGMSSVTGLIGGGSAGLVGGDAAAAGLVGGCAAAELCIVEGGGAGLYAGLCVATHLRL